MSNVHSPNSAESDTQRLILEELRKTNSRLETFSEHLEALDGHLKSVEQMQLNSMAPNSSDGSASKAKRKVPAKVAVNV